MKCGGVAIYRIREPRGNRHRDLKLNPKIPTLTRKHHFALNGLSAPYFPLVNYPDARGVSDATLRADLSIAARVAGTVPHHRHG